MRRWIGFLAMIAVWGCTVAVGSAAAQTAVEKRRVEQPGLHNRSAYIPSQCYTSTRDRQGEVHNPCFSCHTRPRRPNYIDDADLQLSYSFADTARKNPWRNLFKDRREAIGGISDKEMQEYIGASNYFDQQGSLKLQRVLQRVPADWDYNGNGRWDGFVPDAWFNFDEEGFDRDSRNNYTGWRAFGYYPFPGTFWPTNGSTDDVLIRLPKAFRTDIDGKPDMTVYKTNLAIVEAMLKEQDVFIDPVNEEALGGVDIDKDGVIGTATKIRYEWAPRDKRFMWYLGKAHMLQKEGKLHIAAGLYPEGTEFLHTVRYIDVDDNGDNHLTPRMKEVRYALKRFWVNYSKLKHNATKEFMEKQQFPNRLRQLRGNSESGVSNGQGWVYAGFIEDEDGELRPQSYEESVYCVGCHGGIGANRDGIFSFHRKFSSESHRNGWYHWSQKGVRGVPEMIRSDGEFEYSFYLGQNGSGNEFRTNREVREKFFDRRGRLKSGMIEQLHDDISLLLFASKKRAMELNKAYRVIVREQSFAEGRDATAEPVSTLHREVGEDEMTGVQKAQQSY